MIGVTVALSATSQCLSVGTDALSPGGLENRRLLGANGITIVATTNEHYPLETRRLTDTRTIVIEGVHYGRNPLEGSLGRDAHDLDLSNVMACAAFARRWSEEVDGEYLVVLADTETSSVFTFNDFLGRLPVSWASDHRSLVLSRSGLVVANALGLRDLDPVGCAEGAWLGHPLADRTFVRGVKSMRNGSILCAQVVADSVVVKTAPAAGIPITPYAGTRSAAGPALAEDLRRACDERTMKAPNLLFGMSGGLDSRAIASALTDRARSKTWAYTYNRSHAEDEEVAVAAQVAKRWGYDWREIEAGPAGSNDDQRLIAWLAGLNHVGMAFALPLFEHLLTRCPTPAWIISGDGGDQLIPPVGSPVTWSRIGRLPELIEHRYANVRAASVELAFGLEPGTLHMNSVEALRHHQSSGLEPILAFGLLEFSRRWLFEGEDRNRQFSWATTPFYSRHFVSSSLGMPLKFKAGFRLYRDMLVALDQQTADLPYVGRGNLRLRSPEWILRESIRSAIPPDLRSVIRRLRPNGKPTAQHDPALYARGLVGPNQLSKLLESSFSRTAYILQTQSLLAEQLGSAAKATWTVA